MSSKITFVYDEDDRINMGQWLTQKATTDEAWEEYKAHHGIDNSITSTVKLIGVIDGLVKWRDDSPLRKTCPECKNPLGYCKE